MDESNSVGAPPRTCSSIPLLQSIGSRTNRPPSTRAEDAPSARAPRVFPTRSRVAARKTKSLVHRGGSDPSADKKETTRSLPAIYKFGRDASGNGVCVCDLRDPHRGQLLAIPVRSPEAQNRQVV